MKPSHVSQALISLVPTGVPIYAWGAPGIGKSDIIKAVAKKLEMQMIDCRAVTLDPVDLRGLPHVNGDNRAHWCPPAFLPHDQDSKGILFLDELAQAPPLVQSACLQLTLDRRLGEYVMPPGWVIIAASNRQQDRAGTHRLITPLLNRFIHLDVEVNVEDWLEWAAQNGVRPEVRSFIMFKPSMLHNFDPTANERAFPTPRSWHFVSKVLASSTRTTRNAVIAGCVGDGPGAEFAAYMDMYLTLPKVDDILANPETHKVPEEPGVLWALVGAISDRVKDAKGNTMTAIAKFGVRMMPEYAALMFRQSTIINPAFIKTAEVRQWAREHGELFQAA